jgi:hypothetical protein
MDDRIVMTSRAGTNIGMKILLEEKMSKVILETLMPAMIDGHAIMAAQRAPGQRTNDA